ncbi:MAG: hypothetical protein CBB97_10175 [Candidatus Endolissoclinum sp. TMED37]|nr:MAG: hypothetical protein CBB97_10175 [Candidatus Endolissoclinum sp. TMED37]
MNIQSLVHTALNAERYSPEYKSAWRSLFKLAESTCKLVTNRDLDPSILVDDWVAQYDDTINHCNPDDDAVTGDMSCMQSMREQQRAFLNDIRIQYITNLRKSNDRSYTIKVRREYLNIAKRLRKLWNEENNTNIQSVPFEVYEEMPDSAVFETVDDISDTERYVNRQESRLTFYQESECDPDDSHYVADTTRRNRNKPRGNIGLLNGLYEMTDPEPSYQTPEMRRCMLRSLSASDNPDDIRMLYSLTQPTRRNETDEQWSIKTTKRRKLRDAHISRLS